MYSAAVLRWELLQAELPWRVFRASGESGRAGAVSTCGRDPRCGAVLRAAWARLSELLAAVELGEEVTITRRRRPVARIVAVAESPVAALTRRERVAGAFLRLREMRQGRTLGGSLREVVEDGRD